MGLLLIAGCQSAEDGEESSHSASAIAGERSRRTPAMVGKECAEKHPTSTAAAYGCCVEEFRGNPSAVRWCDTELKVQFAQRPPPACEPASEGPDPRGQTFPAPSVAGEACFLRYRKVSRQHAWDCCSQVYETALGDRRWCEHEVELRLNRNLPDCDRSAAGEPEASGDAAAGDPSSPSSDGKPPGDG